MASFEAASVQITVTEEIAAGPFSEGGLGPTPVTLPAHCRLTGVIDKRIGVGGKPYGIHFEMRLPQEWNGRFLFQGGGGTNGFVAPAIGAVKGPAALTRGYAVVTQDGGHEGADASFGEDQQARIDMIYRSYDRVTTIAKQLVAAYYGKPADHSYFFGCSEGGREAMLVSQRLPLEYDGVIDGASGGLLGVTFHANTDQAIVAHFAPRGADGKPAVSKAFSDTDLKLIEAKIEADCDALDGLKDGLIDNPTGCHPKLDRLVCKASKKTDLCLTKPQVRTVRALFEGGFPTGYGGALSQGYFYDTAIDLPAWRGKMSGSGRPSQGVSSVQGLFLTPYDPNFDDTNIDFAKMGSRFEEVGSLNRTDGVMYSSFKLHGGKMLMYIGVADPSANAKEVIAYYRKLSEANGGQIATANFARLFLVPGMTHCRGGRSLDEFDPLQTLVEWVEQKKAPDFMIATGKAFPGRSRPLCAYPTQSRYLGTGSIEDAVNFGCRIPEAHPYSAAQSPAQPSRPSAYYPAGDPQRGERLAAGCVPCHSAAAPPLGNPPVHAPRLRHQRASAIFYALQDYKSGRRENSMMRPFTASLSEQDMRDIAVYLAGERAPIPTASLTGAHDQAASLCAFCHGETGLGEMDGYPVLTGQSLDYLEKALADYRSGSRSDPTMSVIAKEITRSQAHTLAEYFAAYTALEPLPTAAPAP